MINISSWPGLYGMYMPDAIAQYQANGKTYLVTANEGDAREWLRDEAKYFEGGDLNAGYAEEIRIKHLFKNMEQRSPFLEHISFLVPQHGTSPGTVISVSLSEVIFRYPLRAVWRD